MATGGNVIGLKGISGHGNVLTGSRHMVAPAHYQAAHAGFLILEAGGNAVDAGVAAGIALGVTQCDLVNVAGVAARAPETRRNGSAAAPGRPQRAASAPRYRSARTPTRCT